MSRPGRSGSPRARELRGLAAAAAAVWLASSCGGAAPPAAERPSRDPAPAPERGAPASRPRAPLPDGATLVTHPSDAPVVTLRVAFDAGSASETPGREGLTNLTARTMAEGGAGELSYAERTAALYPMAGAIAARVSRDQTAFVGQVHRDHLEDFYPLFRDALTNPRMNEEDFARVKEQARNALEVDLRSADDEALGKEALQAWIYQGHPYGHPPLGTLAGLRRSRVDDARAHRSRVLCAPRAIVGVTGDVPDGFAARLERDLARLRSDACVGLAALPPVARVEAPRVRVVRKPDAQAVAVSMGFPYAITRAHEDYPAVLLAAVWLGQHRQFIGRLMQAIRSERGLNYGAYAYAEHFTQQGYSPFPVPNDARRQQYFSIWLRPLRPEAAHFAVRLAVRELRRLVDEGLTEAQLAHARRFADRYFALYLQTASRRLGFAMDDAYYGLGTPFLERLRAAWAALTPEAFHAAIARHIDPERLSIVLVASDAEALADAIARDAPSPIDYASTVAPSVLEEDEAIVGYPLGIPRERIEIVAADTLFEE